jgi:hypothetical protein
MVGQCEAASYALMGPPPRGNTRAGEGGQRRYCHLLLHDPRGGAPLWISLVEVLGKKREGK